MSSPETCRFMKSHEWVHLQQSSATVGVSDHAQHEISDVVFVELPKVGRAVKQGEAVAVVESVKAAFDIYSPLSGEVTAVNEKIAKDPAIVNRAPHEDGWLFKLKASKPEEAALLMDHAQYLEFVKTAAAH